MLPKIIKKKDLKGFVEALIEHNSVVAPVKKDSKYAFAEIERFEDMSLTYDTTMLSPKKYFFPQEETVLKYKLGETPTAESVVAVEPRTRIIFGIHPCDIAATWLLDVVFSKDPADPNYMEKRKRALLIGYNCGQPCDKYAFCKDMGTYKAESGYDLMLTDLGDRYFVEIGTPEGEALLTESAEYENASGDDLKALQKFNEEKEARFVKRIPVRHEVSAGDTGRVVRLARVGGGRAEVLLLRRVQPHLPDLLLLRHEGQGHARRDRGRAQALLGLLPAEGIRRGRRRRELPQGPVGAPAAPVLPQGQVDHGALRQARLRRLRPVRPQLRGQDQLVEDLQQIAGEPIEMTVKEKRTARRSEPLVPAAHGADRGRAEDDGEGDVLPHRHGGREAARPQARPVHRGQPLRHRRGADLDLLGPRAGGPSRCASATSAR